jgi:hypothetical protein
MKKKRNECQSRRKSKVFRLPFLISQQKRLFDQSSFIIQMSLGVFQSKISHENKSRKILIFAALTFISLIFRYEIFYAKYVDLLHKLKEVEKSQFFSTVIRPAVRPSMCPSVLLWFHDSDHRFYVSGEFYLKNNFLARPRFEPATAQNTFQHKNTKPHPGVFGHSTSWK